ncbi:MAG: hypothetical protein ACTSVF_05590 [Candidatus Asgardarchaeia archaeon]
MAAIAISLTLACVPKKVPIDHDAHSLKKIPQNILQETLMRGYYPKKAYESLSEYYDVYCINNECSPRLLKDVFVLGDEGFVECGPDYEYRATNCKDDRYENLQRIDFKKTYLMAITNRGLDVEIEAVIITTKEREYMYYPPPDSECLMCSLLYFLGSFMDATTEVMIKNKEYEESFTKTIDAICEKMNNK